jgi:uncharacterized protein (DUF885 family)
MCRLALILISLPLIAQNTFEELGRLYKEYSEYDLREFPEVATFAGRREFNDRWTDFSPAAVERRRSAYSGFLQRARHYSAKSIPESDRMNYRLFVDRLECELELMDLRSYYFVASHYGGLTQSVLSTMDAAPDHTIKDFENRIARLEALPATVDSLIAAAEEGLRRKLEVPRRSVEIAIGIYERQIAPGPEQSPLLKSFRQMPRSIPEVERKRLTDRAVLAYQQAYRPAWRKLSDYLKISYAPKVRTSVGLSDNFNGSELYRILIRQHTTTTLSAQEIHNLGLKEMDRITKEMAAIRASTGFVGTPKLFEANVLGAPSMLFHSEAEILAHGREIAKRIDPLLPKLFRRLPRMPYGVEPIPAAIARTAAPHYRPPALDGSRAGYLYLRTVDPEKQSRCCMESLILHEAVPGHHLQFALALEMEKVPEFRKMGGYTAFGEGWGLYAESLGQELGMYENPYEQYGRLQGEIIRAARLVVDTGVHALGWSREQMIAAMAPGKGGWLNDDFIASEVDRYIANPGQALAYKVVGLKIQELRRKSEQALGAKFDVREFHDVVLRNGSIPLNILEEEVDAWIASKRQ